MKQKNETSYAPGELKIVNTNVKPTEVTIIPTNYRVQQNIVSPGALLKGDKKAPLPWNYSIETINYPRGSSEFSNQNGITQYYRGPIDVSSWSVGPSNPQLMRDACYNDALFKFNEKVRGTLDLSVDLAQASQTAGMINAANQIVNLARDLKRNPVKKIGSLWLEYQYGWKPLLGTIHGILDQMGGDGEIYWKPLRTTAQCIEQLPREVFFSPQGLSRKCQVVGESSARCKIQGTVKVTGISPATVSSLNPASIAWELLPFSFVADWFTSVGDTLRAWETSALYGSSWGGGFYTITHKTTGYIICNDPGSSFYKSFHCSGSFMNVMSVRKLLPAYPSPRPIQVRVDLGSSRMLNAAALLAQLLR